MQNELNLVRKRHEFVGFKPQSKSFNKDLGGDIEKCQDILSGSNIGKANQQLRKAIEEEVNLYGENKLNNTQKEARQMVYENKSNFLELVPEVDIQDYGEKLHE